MRPRWEPQSMWCAWSRAGIGQPTEGAADAGALQHAQTTRDANVWSKPTRPNGEKWSLIRFSKNQNQLFGFLDCASCPSLRPDSPEAFIPLALPDSNSSHFLSVESSRFLVYLIHNVWHFSNTRGDIRLEPVPLFHTMRFSTLTRRYFNAGAGLFGLGLGGFPFVDFIYSNTSAGTMGKGLMSLGNSYARRRYLVSIELASKDPAYEWFLYWMSRR